MYRLFWDNAVIEKVAGDFGFTKATAIGDNCVADNAPVVPENAEIRPPPEDTEGRGNNGNGNGNEKFKGNDFRNGA